MGSDNKHTSKEQRILKMKTNLLEKQIEGKVCDYAKSKGCLCYKFTSPSRRSVPDRLFITPSGKVFFIEFKRAGAHPTEAQAVEIAKLTRQGVDVYVCDNVNDGRDQVNYEIGAGVTL